MNADERGSEKLFLDRRFSAFICGQNPVIEY